MQKLLGLTRAAADSYGMIEDGDRIAVGVSGGKDSVALLYTLEKLRAFYPKSFTLTAVTLDPQFENAPTDYSAVTALCESLQIPHIIRRSSLGEVIFETRREKNPCSLCAKMRRGILHDMAKAADCNKIALGHHKDDAAETFLMNLLGGGKIGCFSPVSYLSNKDLYMIRPFVLAYEKDIIRVTANEHLPVVKSRCPADGCTRRSEMRTVLLDLEKQYPGAREKILHALRSDHISKW